MGHARAIGFGLAILAVGFVPGVGAQSMPELRNSGNTKNDHSDFRGALADYERGLELANKQGDKEYIGLFINNIGVVYREQADYPKALDCLQKALKIRRDIGDKKGEASTLNNLGLVSQSLHDYPKALDYFHQALKIDRVRLQRFWEFF